MKYQSVNEFSHFSFSDCVLTEMSATPAGVQLTLEALIVLPENSQNTNFTASYAGTVQLRLLGGQFTESVKEGYQYRDANDVLLESVPDTLLSPTEVSSLLPELRDVYLFQILSETKADGKILLELGIEFPQAEEYDTLITPSYRIGVLCEKAVFGWDYYMNRVES